MWNKFEAYKSINYNFHFKNRNISGELEKQSERIVAENIKNGTEKTKAELQAFTLKNAKLHVIPGDIFAFDIENFGIMDSFYGKKYQSIQLPEGHEKEIEKLNNKTFRADMDFGHVSPDWEYILQKGITGIIAELEFFKKTNPNCAEYYDNRIYVYTAIKNCFLRFAEQCEGKNGENYRFIAENLRYLAFNPPKTLPQALQLILIYYVLQNEIDTVIIRSLGGIDRLLYRFYRSDIDNNTYSKAQLTEILKYFLWDISLMKTLANLPLYICGLDQNGKDATNEFTRLFLNCYRLLGIFDPKIHVLYHKDMDESLLAVILEMIREGNNSFVFINTELASRSLERIGISAEDAKRVTVYGCYETAAEGTEVPCTCAGKFNLLKPLEAVLGCQTEYTNFEDFFEAVMLEMEDSVASCMRALTYFEGRFNEVCPSMLMSPTYKASRESGIDLYSGGAKYNNTSVVGAGLASLVDSLVAVKNAVFEQKIVTYEELKSILAANWQGAEKLQLYIKTKFPKFGNANDEADLIAVKIYNRFADFINGKKNGRGGVFRCGMFSVDWRMYMGNQTTATPDGRVNGEPFSKNLAPAIGQDKAGVTAYFNSLLKLDGSRVPDGYVSDVVLHSSAVAGEDGFKAFESLLKVFMQRGGFAVHFNVLSPQTLINAQKEPEKYKNLQIRLCGWNVRFIDLDKSQQDEFILQSTNAEGGL